MEAISEVKLVVIILSDDLKWQKNTDFITRKAMKKMWILRRLKHMNMSTSFLIDMYTKEVKFMLEQAVPIWNAGLTVQQVRAIDEYRKLRYTSFLTSATSIMSQRAPSPTSSR